MTVADTPSPMSIDIGTPWPPNKPMWVFGYGSIIYRVDFPIEDTVFGYIRGCRRAFLQQSHDHRGTEENPGRVCTLVSSEQWGKLFGENSQDDICWGVAYKVKAGLEAKIKEHLDYREKDGYSIEFVDVFNEHGERTLKDVMVYVGQIGNPSFAGPEDISDTAKVIARAEGPSGTNREYLFKLCAALRDRNPMAIDEYLVDLEKRVRTLVDDGSE